MGEPYTPEEIAEIRAVLTDPLAFMLLDDGEQHVTHARWTATVDALSARVDALTKERDEAVGLAARREGQFNEQTRLALAACAECDERIAALTADRDALAALLAGAYEKCAKAAEDCACPLAREGRRSDRYGFCGHARCGHFHEAADAIRALARIDAASGGK